MKFLTFTMILIFNCLMVFGQVNRDSLLKVWEDESKTNEKRLTAIHKISTHALQNSKPDIVLFFAFKAFDFAKRKNLKKEMAIALLSKAYKEKGNYKLSLKMKNLSQNTKDSMLNLKTYTTVFKKEYQSGNTKRKNPQEQLMYTSQKMSLLKFILLGSLILFLIGIVMFQNKKIQQNSSQQNKLTQEIEQLKKKLAIQSVSLNQNRQEFGLNKEKIENFINAKLGATSWMILEIIFETPSISNQEIAKRVSLSLEGVSSSLRRMYIAFDIQSSSNKKVTLLMKAIQISMAND